MLATFIVSLGLAAAGPAGPAPLGGAHHHRFWASPEDAAPARRARKVHYWAGNERELFVFRRALRNLGGGYVGVGADQAYLFMGWMRPVLAWLIDYDPEVVAVHWIHRAFFLESPDRQAFYARWTKEGRAGAIAILRRAYPGARGQHLARIYRRARVRVYWRLSRVRQAMRRRRVPTFLTDRSTYEYVRRLVRSGRVRPMLANLLADKGMRGIARTARRLGVPIRALYLSNAEQYWWRYSPQYRKNIKALQLDGRSIVLRTLSRHKTENIYSYQIQPGANYATWMGVAALRRVYQLPRRRIWRLRSVKLYRAGGDPAQWLRRRARRRRRR